MHDFRFCLPGGLAGVPLNPNPVRRAAADWAALGSISDAERPVKNAEISGFFFLNMYQNISIKIERFI